MTEKHKGLEVGELLTSSYKAGKQELSTLVDEKRKNGVNNTVYRQKY